MNKVDFQAFLDDQAALIGGLLEKKIFLVTPLQEGGLLNDAALADHNCSCFEGEDIPLLQELFQSPWLSNYAYPVVIDVVKALGLYKGGARGAAQAETALSMSRFSFMGTDGMRGKVVETVEGSPFGAFLRENQLSPELINLTCQGFVRLLLATGEIKAGQSAVVGNDGRDQAVDGMLNTAMIQGFTQAGVNVLDLGVVPTPYVPYQMLKKDHPLGAALTASHNPSHQNGIKFFLHGKKLLPEGKLGDYALSAHMLDAFINPAAAAVTGSASMLKESQEEALALLRQVVPSDLAEKFNDAFFILDQANGAFAGLAECFMEELGLPFKCVNQKPNGFNINKNCGVAEVEGNEFFDAQGYDEYLPVVKAMFDQGRSRDNRVLGVVLDGDGDRGFVLSYDKANDQVVVVEGDKSGYIFAENKIKTEGVNPSDYSFVVTVESDLMTAYHGKKTLGLNTSVVSVGDKWIGSFDKGELLIGLEASGHIIFPIEVVSDSGKKDYLKAGNGLLSALMTLDAMAGLNLDNERIMEPFEGGYTKTFYTYFVDKSLFFRGSDVWNKDQQLIEEGFKKNQEAGMFPADSELVFPEMDDKNMLYAAVEQNGAALAAVFCRNSGTEDKTAVYVQGSKDMESFLEPWGRGIARFHQQNMKNPQRTEFALEKLVLSILEEKGEMTEGDCISTVLAHGDCKGSETDLKGVLYGLKKEERIKVTESGLSILK